MDETPMRSVVTVDEVVKRRQSLLKEDEAWAVLCQAVQAIQDLFLNGKSEEMLGVVDVRGDRLELTGRGRVRLLSAAQPHTPPPPSDTLREKMLIYNLGVCVESLTERSPRTHSLNQLLSAMTSPDIFKRASLMHLLDVISDYCSSKLHNRPFSHIIMEMYESVVGKKKVCKVKSLNLDSAENSNTSSSSSDKSRCCDGEELNSFTRRKVYKQMTAANAKYCGPNTIIGPEFIVMADQPPKQMQIISRKNSIMKKVLILLLNGKRIEVSCNPSTTFGQIFKLVVDSERYEYSATLGLASLLSGDFVIPPHEYKISKLAPQLWLTKGMHVTYTLYLRFRLYLPSLRGVSSWKWKHMLYLQLRRNLLDKLILCNKNELRALAGLALQAEFGDYNPKEHGSDYFLIEHYLPPGEECSVSELQSLHKQRKGMDPGKAEEMFISHVMYIPGYGIHYFTAHTAESESSKLHQVGVNSKGLVLSHGSSIPITPQHIFPWSDIKKLTHTKCYFEIVTSDAKHRLRLDKNKSFFLFRLAWLHHKFFMKISNEFTSLQLLSEEFGGVSREVTKSPSVLHVESPARKRPEPGMLRRAATFLSPEKGAIFRGKTATHCRNRRSESCRETRENYKVDIKNLDFELKYLKHAVSTCSDGSSVCGGRRGILMGTRAISRCSSYDNQVEVTKIEVPSVQPDCFEAPPSHRPYVLNSSIKSIDERFEINVHESISESLAEKIDQMALTQKRVLITICLKRNINGSLGLQVTEGKDGGVYVLSVLEGGPAHKSGQITTGDQIQAVNGQSVLNLPYDEVLKVVERCGDSVELVLSQIDRGQQTTPGGAISHISCSSQVAGLDLLANVLQKPIESSYLKVIRFNMESELDHHMMISELPNLSYL